MLLSYVILDSDKHEVLSSASHQTFAAIKAPEKYEALKDSLVPCWEEINELVKHGKVDVNDDVEVEVFLTGDYKFLLIVMGMNKACSKNACLWCTMANDERWDNTKAEGHYYSETKARTLKSLHQCHSKKTCGQPFGEHKSPTHRDPPRPHSCG